MVVDEAAVGVGMGCVVGFKDGRGAPSSRGRG